MKQSEETENRRPAGTGAAVKSEAQAGKYSHESKKARRVGRQIKAGKCIIADQKPASGGEEIWDKALLRMREVERVITKRFGRIIPSDINPEGYLKNVAHAIHVLKRPVDLETTLRSWCRRFAPYLLDDFDVVFHPVRMGLEGRRFGLSDSEAGLSIELTWEERVRYDIRTMNASDISLEEQRKRVAANRRERDAKRKRDERAERGAMTREEYLASVSKGRPWEALGISKSTYYEQRKMNRTGSAHPAQNESRTGSAHTARTGSALTRDIYTNSSEYGSDYVVSAEPVRAPPLEPSISDIELGLDGGVSPPAKGAKSSPVTYASIKNGDVPFVAPAGSLELPAVIEPPVKSERKKRASR